jgi:glucose dehydrogenase
MAAYVYKDQVILGTGGGDNGNIGLVSAFSVKDGASLWDWSAIPLPDEPGHETWPGESWRHGGASPWNGLAIDQDDDTLFVTPGNPGPDMVLKGREGKRRLIGRVGYFRQATKDKVVLSTRTKRHARFRSGDDSGFV